MRYRKVVKEYLSHFCSGNIEGIESTLAAEFRLSGPLFECDCRDAYIAALRENPPEKASYRILEVLENDAAVAVFYEHRKQTGLRTIAQLFKIREGKIVESLLVFDATLAAEGCSTDTSGAKSTTFQP